MTRGAGYQSSGSSRPKGKAARSSGSESGLGRQTKLDQAVGLSDAAPAAPTLGVVYLCIGRQYQELAETSISFLRAFGYSGPVRALTASNSWKLDHLDCEVTRVPFRGLGFSSRYYKTQINQYGFDTTLFLDADTLPIANIRPIWRELRFADICLSRDLHVEVRDLIKLHYGDRKRCRPEYYCMGDLGLLAHRLYSSGVILFRRTLATDKLFEAWHQEWDRFRQEDQLALVRAIARTKPPVHQLTRRWNGWQTWFKSISLAQNSGVRILHNVHKLPREELLGESLIQLVGTSRRDLASDLTHLASGFIAPKHFESAADVDGQYGQKAD